VKEPHTIEEPLPFLVASGRFREALALFLASTDSLGTLPPQSQVLAAQASARIGELELSTHLATAARGRFRGTGDVEGELEATNLLGAIAFERGRIQDAQARFQEVMELAGQTENAVFLARAANNLASVADLRGESDESRSLFQQALEAYQRIGDQRGIAETFHNIALTQRGKGTSAAAFDACAQAIEAAEIHGEAGLIALTLLGRAEILIESQSYAEATRDIERAEVLAWSAGNEPHQLEAGRLRTLVALRQGLSAFAHQGAEFIRARAVDAGFAMIAGEAASISALALKASARHAEADAARACAIASFEALGAVELIERFDREWQKPAA